MKAFHKNSLYYPALSPNLSTHLQSILPTFPSYSGKKKNHEEES